MCDWNWEQRVERAGSFLGTLTRLDARSANRVTSRCSHVTEGTKKWETGEIHAQLVIQFY